MGNWMCPYVTPNVQARTHVQRQIVLHEKEKNSSFSYELQ